MQYIGQSVPEFNGRYKTYKSDFRIEARRKSIELSKYICLIKERVGDKLELRNRSC